MSLPRNIVYYPPDLLPYVDGGYATEPVQPRCGRVVSCIVTVGLRYGYAPTGSGPKRGHALSVERGIGVNAFRLVVGHIGQPPEWTSDAKGPQPPVWYGRRSDTSGALVDSGVVYYRQPVFGTPGRLTLRLHQRHDEVPPPRWLALSYLPENWPGRYCDPNRTSCAPWSCPVSPQAEVPTPVRAILTVLAAHGQRLEVDPQIAHHWARAQSRAHQWCRLATAFNWLPGQHDIFVGYSSWQGLLYELDRGPVLVTLDWPPGALSSQPLGKVHPQAENLHLIVIGMKDGFVQLVDVTPGQEERIYLLSQSLFLRAWANAGGIIYHLRDRRS
ncbi:MAG: hypothetical protein CEO22_528 [Candidatus Berkelbacteria bacterium Gr01-1014_85]|uniref:Uncharacterized protein n=1 Tax=Candidatus Berkelbacteria bacterium Gr01-1014_85 TaxID=2017150 RepID=A0A554JAC1_9BACT|nr:MAG: hypothetical protein CEO22_528 [Candidatus Berkelbacteria bacterium Gr01-1014_85]